MTDDELVRHNEEVRRIKAAYARGAPERVPVRFAINARMLLLDPAFNRGRWTARRVLDDPRVNWELLLEYQRWARFEVPQDEEMGLPEQWSMDVCLWNIYEAGWFGCEIWFPEDDVPDTKPMFAERKERLYETPLPDPLRGNLMGRVMEHREALDAMRKKEDFLGRPVAKPGLPSGTDGPVTVACNLRGATELCGDLMEDEKYFHDLLAWITDGIIARVSAANAETGSQGLAWFADDSISLLSARQYRDHVLPHHRRLLDAFAPHRPHAMHLCGKVQHLLPLIAAELDIRSFELGYPTDLGQARAELGPAVELIGNIAPMLLRSGPPALLEAAVKNACEGGAMRGGRFILMDGNNVAPGTPLAHFAAMYEAGKRWGRYRP
mgnify:CR=1 FL=1